MRSIFIKFNKNISQSSLCKGVFAIIKLFLSQNKIKQFGIGVLAILSVVCFQIAGCVNKEASSQSTSEKAPASERVFPVSIWHVKTHDIIYTIDATCSMFAECDTDVSAEVDGRIQKIFFEEGDVVSEGDSLVWLDDERYRSIAQENLANWRLTIANLKNVTRLLKRKKKLFHDGVI